MSEPGESTPAQDAAPPKAKQHERKESVSSTKFYQQLARKISELGNSSLSLMDFNVYCCQQDPDLRKYTKSERAGHIGIHEAAEYFDVDYKTIYRMIQNDEITAGQFGKVYAIPASAILLHANLSIWHNQEQDANKRMSAMQNGDLSVLEIYSGPHSIPHMWNSFVSNVMHASQPPIGLGWKDLISIPDRLQQKT